MERFDKYWIGILLGLLVPAIFGYAYVEQMDLWFVLRGSHILSTSTIMSKIMLITVFPDLAMIFLFYTMELWRVSKGILIGALPYLLLSMWYAI